MGISVTKEEARTSDAYDYAAGFVGLNRMRIDGTDFVESFIQMQKAVHFVRRKKTSFSLC